ncbi:MAG: hypothetical protein ACRYGK_14630 [Janthinobacterium lividum]
MPIVSQAEYARIRGVSKKTVTQWKQEGKLVMVDGSVDVDASDAYLSKYRTAGLKGNAKGNDQGNGSGTSLPALPKAKKGESAAAAAERILTLHGAEETIEEARRIKENYLALLHKLEYDEKSGAVVLASEVAAAVGTEYAKVRTRLLALPAEQAPRLHRCKTVAEVQDMLQELITEALEELTRNGGN